jgi:chromosome segregation ATPase
MEDELKAISSELAASIRREMDLEDLVDRLQEQITNPQAPSKRSSDYFSDSGYSSAKVSEYDQSREEIGKIQRRSEQEKASIRLELSSKLQDERSRRKVLDQQIKDLAEKASQMDLAHMNNLDASDRVKELEKSCEDLRRRLSEEKESKTNFEDLLSGLKSELQDACNERDNLREEVVPQLRARVEGLEAEAASYANLTYESTKMQHQLQSLKQENTSLRNSLGPDDFTLARSNSVAASSFKSRAPSSFGGRLTRSESVKHAQSESREALAERLKDVEAQRDALHKALKSLLDRQEFQNRENEKKIKILEVERQRLLLEPRKAGYDKEVSSLRTEINVLRRRAEEALEQKWQVEKGLGGLKMDLDRAEEEIASLRSLLQEKDILIPPTLARSSGLSDASSDPVTSESLQQAYQDLQKSYSESLERMKELELHTGDSVSDEKVKVAIQRLEQSLSTAISERDAARRHLDGLRDQVEVLSAGESKNLEQERALSDELGESALRVEQLASQVQQQLSTNAELRRRLADAVVRGDSDRKLNSERITELQARLHALEEQLVMAQTASEDRVGRHEDELSHLREANNEQLRRINNGGGVGVTARNGSLLNPTASAMFRRSGQAISPRSFEEEVEIKTLRARVAELEKALADAEEEIQQVVSKMNEAQIQVMNLQEERETAARETRRLQKTLQEAKLVPLSGRA